jgi:hypothetical protein
LLNVLKFELIRTIEKRGKEKMARAAMKTKAKVKAKAKKKVATKRKPAAKKRKARR